jgi:tetratricopeptide (TPR) repeat protein
MIGDYVLSGEIARGGLGVVYRARCESLQREVAIKLLLSGHDASEVAHRRFQREAEALGRLRHPNVVAIHGAGEHQGSPYVVMEFVDGMSLQHRISTGGPLPVAEAVRVAIDVARALSHAHESRVLHRDVKPSNVLLSPSGEALLTDFGLAKDLSAPSSSLTQSGMFMGTPYYWPPEQALGQPERMGPASDIYALGATLFAALTAEPPFRGENLVEALRTTVEDPAPAPSSKRPGLNPDLDRICLRCLEKDPLQRYPSAADLIEALEGWLRGERAQASRRPAFALGALLLLALGATLAHFGLRSAPVAASAPALSPPSQSEAAEVVSVTAPRSARDWLAAGNRALEARSLVEAVRAFSKAIELDPNFVEAYDERAQAYLRARDPRALPDMERALKLAPTGTRYASRGSHWLSRRRFDVAILDFDRALSLEPDNVVALVNRSFCHSQLSHNREAISDLDRVVKIAPRNFEAHYNRALLREEYGDVRGALEGYRRTLYLCPEHGRAWLMVARSKFQRGEFSQAEDDLTQAIANLTEDPRFLSSAYQARAATRTRLGKDRAAALDLEQTLRINPKRAQAEAMRTTIDKDLGRPSRY